MPSASSLKIPTVDLSPFVAGDRTLDGTISERERAGEALVAACHNLGFVKVTGHGFSTSELNTALAWVRRLFDLPIADKMQAPHPTDNMPHRGYSGVGLEKVYAQEDMEQNDVEENVGSRVREITDFKESYEIGSERDDQQQNIWLPESVLPGFRTYVTSLYERLADVAKLILEAIGVGLKLEPKELASLRNMLSDQHSQLRLLHYPPFSKKKLEKEVFARLPAHRDWGAFTILFQDERGGLELRDPSSEEYVHAVPEHGALVLNIGDMLQRLTNDYFISALHKVSVPSSHDVPPTGVPARYSIPFFIAPKPTTLVETLPRFVRSGETAKYEPVRFEDYGALISKYQYGA